MSIRLIGAIAAAALIVAAVVWTPVFAGQKSSKPKLQFTSVLGPDTVSVQSLAQTSAGTGWPRIEAWVASAR